VYIHLLAPSEHPDMTVPTKLLHFMVKLLRAKKMAAETYLKPQRAKKFSVPGYLRKEFLTNQIQVKNREVVTFRVPNESAPKHIFFLHGGAFTVEAKAYHWRFIRDILKKTSFTLSFINYPLAPENNYRITHDMVLQAYKKLHEMHPDDDFMLVGDSAGGGLCLSIAQALRNKPEMKQPVKLALLSPWLDLSLSNPEIAGLERKDLLLDPKSLIICSGYYAGDLDYKDPIVSPLYGSMQNLHHIGIFVGTQEIFLPDCRKLRTKLEESNTAFTYKEYEGMQHDWMVFPIKERRELLTDIAEYLMSI
jgi:acetyl esterase/lipase